MSELPPVREFPLVPIADYTSALDEVRDIAERAKAAEVGEHLLRLVQAAERALRMCPAHRKSIMRRELQRQLLSLISSTVVAQLMRADVLAPDGAD